MALPSYRALGGAVPFLPASLLSRKKQSRARQWLARSYYGFNRRTWTSRYRQIYNSVQSVRHTQGRCKQGRGPESGCANWARGPGRALSSPGSTLARRAVRRGSSPGQGGHLLTRERSRGPGPATKLGAEVLGDEPSPIFPPRPLQSFKIGFPGAG